MQKTKMIAVVSAYGIMTESDSRYRMVIFARDEEEFDAKLKAFMCAETVRAMSTPELAVELGHVDAAKVYAALDGYTIPREEGEREVIEVPELCTDYHLENVPLITPGGEYVDPSGWKSAIVMTEYDMECFGPSEFPNVMAIYDPASETDENGNPVLIEYSDPCNGTVVMTASALESFLLGRDRLIVPVM